MKNFDMLRLVIGPLEVNCYVLCCRETGVAAVIDPGAEAGRIIGEIEARGWRPAMIINTHGHIDHVAGNSDIADHFRIPVLLHALDEPLLKSEDIFGLAPVLNARPSPPPERLLRDGDTVMVGQVEIQVLHTPGHTPGGCCLLADVACFAGDTVFRGSVGRTDLPGGDYDTLLESIREKILPLPDDVELFPGHGPSTTVGREKEQNPFFRDIG
ncbi:MAG: MBL fold metallo-hydrolase [Acidobacteria bacterium]|nr:MBL fold metallo-hydrolase [Acidobacteriota bacterium]